MKIEIFKKGDKVFHHQYGWGVVGYGAGNSSFPLLISFEGHSDYFTADGKEDKSDKLPTLSFTEYDFVKGGFSQERPLPEIEKDTLIYIKCSRNSTWDMRYFSHFNKKGGVHCFKNQLKSTETNDTTWWAHYSIENPLL